MENMTLAYYAAGAGAIALLFALFTMSQVLKESMGTPKMKQLSEAVQEGAMAYMNRQYKTLAPFAIVIFVLLWAAQYFVHQAPGSHLPVGPASAISFLVGAVCSAIAGYIGMNSTTKSNARTAEAARSSGLGKALQVSFRAGAVMGLSVAGLGLLGVSVLFIIFQSPLIINSFAFGASVIAFFARVGGGIYTKAADVGADLVGKVEAGIPEDDPRNPATIADNVGDNVGDTAGMGADLFESYGATTIAAMLIGNTLFGFPGVIFPLLVGAVGIISAIIGTFTVRTSEGGNPQAALNVGLWSTNVLTAVGTFFVAKAVFPSEAHVIINGQDTGVAFENVYMGIFLAVMAGLIVNVLVGYLTEHYTAAGKGPVNRIAEASKTGPATNVIHGLAVGMESVFFPMLTFAAAIFISYWAVSAFAPEGQSLLWSIYGIAMAAMGMLSTAGMVVAMDSFGPVADNAGGIAEMAELPKEVREKTDKLDAVGNTTAAIAKGFAIGSAALTALALFSAYVDGVKHKFAAVLPNGEFVVNLTEPIVLVGVFIGGAIPFLIGASTMRAVGEAAFGMVEEVRRQFREIPGIMEGTGKPDYARCVDIATRSAIAKMIFPGVVAVSVPILVGFLLGAKALAGFLGGLTTVGVLMALFLANAGGAWDNAKKYIEGGAYGGKKSEPHKAAVIGDTVGDPCKDTSGPAMNPLIKVAGTISLILGPLLLKL
ncbi:pyrophosphate-energized proton pump [Desulfocucumis palustris]|uniref:Putative K(+)-stimulated pyrophosphate-energized sodium pump n=2 Tax=Desulfocucumis palustris TaxID=1898651 RepID=A0A2L2XH83_9FIRM|nr:pyrophosphate-energized proton pump [Desulfocucumis palustris]